ncbi:MAG: hypothetical protein H0W08_26260 [Acidobacteria bacterium]|nr:hypothetical protein [Acidobacteriota bacterium]
MASVISVTAMAATGWWIARATSETPADPEISGTARTAFPPTVTSKQPGSRARGTAKPDAPGREGQALTRSGVVPPPAPPASGPAVSTSAKAAQGSGVPGNVAQPDPSADAIRTQLTASAERWLDAYYAQDRTRLAAFSPGDIAVSDQRPEEERLPGGLANVRRTVAAPRVQVFGSAAILTARVTEHAENPRVGKPNDSVSFISQTWTLREGAWQLNEVRLVSAGALDKAFRR